MRKLMLSLKKEIISDLEANDLKGGAIDRTKNCPTQGYVYTCQPNCNQTDGVKTCYSDKPQSCLNYCD